MIKNAIIGILVAAMINISGLIVVNDVRKLWGLAGFAFVTWLSLNIMDSVVDHLWDDLVKSVKGCE